LLSQAGFQEEGHAQAYLKINGEWRDHVLFGRLSPYEGHDGPDIGVSV
jgi:ribosomal-protein-alanine N-acetyltransferase